MKKKLSVHISYILFGFLMTIGMIACGKEVSGKEIDTLAEAKTDLYESAEELEEDATVVVKVTKTREEENIVKNMGEPDTNYGYTESMVQVEEIRKNISGQDIEVGDKIKILENQFYYIDADGTKVNCHVNQYKKMEPEQEYILYLRYSEQDSWFYILSGLFGKVPVSENEELIFPASKATFFQGQSYEEDADEYEKNIMENIREETLKEWD